jgi:UDPglucose 6-dehydrogenase
MRIGVLGAGYVGLTTAACLAHLGHDVVCVDVDPARVEMLRKGEVPILEAGLPELVEQGLAARRLRFELGEAAAARNADVVFVCVQTPQSESGAANLEYFDTAIRAIAPILSPGAVVVNKSTVPVGSSRRVQRLLAEHGAVLDHVRVASNPEFLREGRAVADFLNPDRIVIGCDDPAGAVRVSDVFRSIQAPVIVTDPQSAEMTKYAANAFLATKIAYINSIANLCEAVDADVREVALGMGYDPRIGFEFLHPGPGYGGSCFPKDTAALERLGREVGVNVEIVEAVRSANAAQHEHIVDKVSAAAGGSLRGVVVAVLGLTFKADTDDLRDSPAMVVAARLLESGATVRAFDPAAGEQAASRLTDLVVSADAYDACTGASVLAVLTEWDEFRWLDFDRIHSLMAVPRIVDARNVLDPASMRRRRFEYTGVGR